MADDAKAREQADLYELQEVVRLFAESDLDDLTIEVGTLKLSVSRRGSQAQVTAAAGSDGRASVLAAETAAPAAPLAPAQDEEPAAVAAPEVAPAGSVEVLSPSGGLFYRCSAPGEAPYVEVGDTVKAGECLCLIEIMKMFTEVASPVDGVVVGIYVDSEDVVEQGGVLMRIKPAEAGA